MNGISDKEERNMAMMECKNCHRLADSRCFRLCSDCGAPLCDDCANEHEGLCRDCEGQDYKY